MDQRWWSQKFEKPGSEPTVAAIQERRPGAGQRSLSSGINEVALFAESRVGRDDLAERKILWQQVCRYFQVLLRDRSAIKPISVDAPAFDFNGEQILPNDRNHLSLLQIQQQVVPEKVVMFIGIDSRRRLIGRSFTAICSWIRVGRASKLTSRRLQGIVCTRSPTATGKRHRRSAAAAYSTVYRSFGNENWFIQTTFKLPASSVRCLGSN